jgi:hypothetical protein
VELECRQEEDENAVVIDLDKASKKSMAKVVNQVSRTANDWWSTSHCHEATLLCTGGMYASEALHSWQNSSQLRVRACWVLVTYPM